jgi:hypothetical protein
MRSSDSFEGCHQSIQTSSSRLCSRMCLGIDSNLVRQAHVVVARRRYINTPILSAENMRSARSASCASSLICLISPQDAKKCDRRPFLRLFSALSLTLQGNVCILRKTSAIFRIISNSTGKRLPLEAQKVPVLVRHQQYSSALCNRRPHAPHGA